MTNHPIITTLALLVIAIALCSGCAINGHPMRFPPSQPTAGGNPSNSLSWYIEGKTALGAPVSCSFIEFDERGDFIDFRQHLHCENTISNLAGNGKVLLFVYCHGWKNNSQSGDVISFNAFLAKLAQTPEIQKNGFRVHGVYLAWRGNPVPPYIDKCERAESIALTEAVYGSSIVDSDYQRSFAFPGFIPENLSYFTRKRAAEHLISGLPMARAIFTYASAAKNYGGKLGNQVIVMGHSFGALMLEKSLGQGMTGALVMDWWNQKDKEAQKPISPFDLVLFVNSAAPSIYAKEMRDFLEAHRKAMGHRPGHGAPIIVSITSTADEATGVLHPLANFTAPFAPSLQRKYTTGIFGAKRADYSWTVHEGIRQSDFYTKTPGHQPLLINHWIIPDPAPATPLPSLNSDDVFARNTVVKSVIESDHFLTSTEKSPNAWLISPAPQLPEKPVTQDGLELAMPESDYWIVSCGKELCKSHGDVWSKTMMEVYAGIYCAVQSRR